MDGRLREIADYLIGLKTSRDFSPGAIATRLLPHLFILDIERDAAGRAAALNIRLTGTGIDNALGRSLQGRKLEDYVHGPRGQDVIAAFYACGNDRTPIWMKQVGRMTGDPQRFVEGVAVHLPPDCIYGGLIVGEPAATSAPASFEQFVLTPA
jgi:hypothetical protein